MRRRVDRAPDRVNTAPREKQFSEVDFAPPSHRDYQGSEIVLVLLEHLFRKLGVRPTIREGSRAQRERWIQKPL
jgi:hypothetical protein